MTNPIYTDIQYDVGEARATLDGSTAINSMLTKAKTFIKNITGTTTGDVHDMAIRSLADAFVVNAMINGLGPESGGTVPLELSRNQFIKDADDSLRLIGKSLDGVKIKFSQVNP